MGRPGDGRELGARSSWLKAWVPEWWLRHAACLLMLGASLTTPALSKDHGPVCSEFKDDSLQRTAVSKLLLNTRKFLN